MQLGWASVAMSSKGAIAKALITGKIVQVVFTYREKLPGIDEAQYDVIWGEELHFNRKNGSLTRKARQSPLPPFGVLPSFGR